MRKALMLMLISATMATPVAASAQEAAPDVREIRAAARAANAERRAASPQRAERREARVAQRTEPRAQRSETRVQRTPEQRQARQAERQVRRAERQQPAPTTPAAQVPARNWPGQQQRTDRVLQERRNDVARAERRADRREDRRDVRVERRDDRRDVRSDRREYRRDVRQDRRNWDRAWRADRRYDWQRYRYANRGLYSVGRYYSPFGNHRYSRLSIGLRLGSGYYSDRYWINDPWQYRLPPAYPGTRWVRYYDDVLLIDMFDGQVVDVIHDFFW